MPIPRFTPHEIVRLNRIMTGFAVLAVIVSLVAAGQEWWPWVFPLVHINSMRFGVVLAAMIITIGWQSFGTQRHAGMAVLALSFLCSGSFDFLYVTRLPGMPGIFPPPNGDASLYFYVIARLAGGAGILLSQCLKRGAMLNARRAWLAFGATLGLSILLAALILGGWMPGLGQSGETLRDVGGSLSLLMASAGALLAWWRREPASLQEPYARPDRVALLAAMLALEISEACFNFASLPFDAQALLGPAFKLAAAWYFYRAVLLGGILGPYAALSETTCALEQAGDDLRQSEARMAGIIYHATDAIINTDADDIIVLANPAAAAMFGASIEQMRGQPVIDFFPQRLRERYRKYVRHYPKARVPCANMNSASADYDVAGLRVNGEEFAMEVSVSTMIDQEARYTTLILRDISERRRVHDELARSHEEAQRLSQALQSVREEERRAIARNLHDDLGQLLAALRIDLTLLQEQAAKAGPQSVQLAHMDALLGSSFNSLHRIAADLRPGALDEGDLYIALQNFCKESAARHDLRCELIATADELTLDDATSTAVFRVVEEALIQVLRDAGAREVAIGVERLNGELLLHLRGVGMRLASEGLENSPGMPGLRARVAAMGGLLWITGPQDNAARIDISLPL